MHPLVPLVLVLPSLVGVENQSSPIWCCCKRFVEHGWYHAQHRSVRDGIADPMPVVQLQNGRKIALLTEAGIAVQRRGKPISLRTGTGKNPFTWTI